MKRHKCYWDALNRLINNKPIRVPKGSKINKDTVALEAGRKRGSIKKSRPAFALLINAIDEAAAGPANERQKLTNNLLNAKIKTESYKELYHQSLNRELMLVEELADLRKLLEQSNVIQFP